MRAHRQFGILQSPFENMHSLNALTWNSMFKHKIVGVLGVLFQSSTRNLCFHNSIVILVEKRGTYAILTSCHLVTCQVSRLLFVPAVSSACHRSYAACLWLNAVR